MSRKDRTKYAKKQIRYNIECTISTFRGSDSYPSIKISDLLKRLKEGFDKCKRTTLKSLMSHLQFLQSKNKIHIWSDKSHLEVIDLNVQALTLTKKSAIFNENLLIEELYPTLRCEKQPPCELCGISLWKHEPSSLCCENGRMLHLKSLTIDSNEPMYDVYFGESEMSRHFMSHPNAYNNHFALSSCGFNSIPEDLMVDGLNSFTIMGQMHHRYQRLSRGESSYLEGLIYDPDHENRELQSPVLDNSIIQQIAPIVNHSNVLFRHIITQYDDHKNKDDVADLSIVLYDRTRDREKHHSQIRAPTDPEIAVLVKPVSQAFYDTKFKQSIVFRLKPWDIMQAEERRRVQRKLEQSEFIKDNSRLYHVNQSHPVADALAFPFIHYKGQSGWYRNMYVESGRAEDNAKDVKVSQSDWYRRQFMERPGEFNIGLHLRKLTQKYMCYAHVACENYRLDYIRYHQKDFKIEKYNEVQRYLNDPTIESTGKMVVLPATFTGGPKWYKKRTMEAIALVLHTGKPDLFLTFTGNIHWPEITESLNDGETWVDRADVVVRVFYSKLKEFIHLLTVRHILGKVKAYLWTVEFQKRGIPHAHILLTFESCDKIRNVKQLDSIISAEIPDKKKNPRLHDIVTKFMIHGNCLNNKKAKCHVNKKCRFNFPKDYCNKTSFVDGEYPKYRRRDEDNGGYVYVKKKKSKRKRSEISGEDGEESKIDNNEFETISNRWVAPYNPVLLLLFNCHINVEFCTSILAVKYITKYVYKGSSHVSYVLKKTGEVQYVEDQIKFYCESRYITAMEAMWRVFKFHLHYKYPAVKVVYPHLPNEQTVLFEKNASRDELKEQTDTLKLSVLESWFQLNKDAKNGLNTDEPSPLSLTYAEALEFYTIKEKTNEWIKKKRGKKTIGYLHMPNNTTSELWYLSTLLRFKKGVTSFEELRTYDGVVCPSFHQACVMNGLINDEFYLRSLLMDVFMHRNGYYLRQLFCTLLISSGDFDASKLWTEFRMGLYSDLELTRKEQYYVDFGLKTKLQVLEEKALLLINEQLTAVNCHLSDYKLPVPDKIKNICREVLEHTFSDDTRAKYKKQYEDNYRQLNSEQKPIVDAIINGQKTLVYVDAPGGCGKTFIAQTISSYFRGNGKIVLNVASTGIAATLLDRGKTVHSQFKVPLEITETSTCDISESSRSGLVQLLRKASLIIWDEAPMSHRFVFECVMRTLLELRKNEKQKQIPMLLMGDFRQCSVIVPNGNETDIIDASICRNFDWRYNFDKFSLTINMRVHNAMKNGENTESMKNWIDYQMSIGNNTAPKVSEDNNEEIYLDNSLIVNCKSIEEFTEMIYPDFDENYTDPHYLKDRAILTPLNMHVREINELCYDRIPGSEKLYYASHEMHNEVSKKVDSEILRSQHFYGMPNNVIKLKRRAMIMCIRNLNPNIGLRNGVKLSVLNMEDRYLECKVITGSHIGNTVHIPRIQFKSNPRVHSLSFTRRQFPIKLCYGMTINKSQGQTLDTVGLYLPGPVFGHGQLYTAISRCGNKDKFKVYMLEDKEQGVIKCGSRKLYYTKNIVFDQFLQPCKFKASVQVDDSISD